LCSEIALAVSLVALAKRLCRLSAGVPKEEIALVIESSAPGTALSFLYWARLDAGMIVQWFGCFNPLKRSSYGA
jgi:hypothetical protein